MQRIYFSNCAFSGDLDDLLEDIVHEFIHAGGHGKAPVGRRGGMIYPDMNGMTMFRRPVGRRYESTSER